MLHRSNAFLLHRSNGGNERRAVPGVAGRMFDWVRRHYLPASAAVAALIVAQLVVETLAVLRAVPRGGWNAAAHWVEAATLLLVALLHYGRPNRRPAQRDWLQRHRAAVSGMLLLLFLVAFWESLALQAALGAHLLGRLLPDLLLVAALAFLVVDWLRGRPDAQLG